MTISLLGISFDFIGMSYYRTSKDAEVGSYAVCETPHGVYLGKIEKIRKPTEKELENPDFETLFPQVIRLATFQDMSYERLAIKKEEEISKETQKQSDALKLDMKILKSYLDLSDNKVLITFTADARVDFRELVKILSGMFHLKVELRQIGPRDSARLIGGIGACGLELCCSKFLRSFEGISINMAKNQLLSLTIPKISGQCGKLMCCLKYEDDAYSRLRPLYPDIGTKIEYNGQTYEVTSENVLSDSITLYNGSNYETFTKEEFERVKKGLPKSDQPVPAGDVNSGVNLSGKGIQDTNSRIQQINRTEEQHRKDVMDAEKKSRNNYNKNNKNRNNNNNNRNSNYNNRNRNNSYNSHSYSNNAKHESSGFIKVSQIADREVLSIKGTVPSKKEKEEDDK